jgi:hypothetical protein
VLAEVHTYLVSRLDDVESREPLIQQRIRGIELHGF